MVKDGWSDAEIEEIISYSAGIIEEVRNDDRSGVHLLCSDGVGFVPDEDVDNLAAKFGVNSWLESEKAIEWCRTAPKSKRPTMKGARRFLMNWFGRAKGDEADRRGTTPDRTGELVERAKANGGSILFG